MQVESYFEFTRTEIEPLLPPRAGRILELGCGHGNTLKWLKSVYPGAETVGAEYWHEAQPHLAGNADHAVTVDLEQPWPADLDGPFDLILALDVLEHLRDPDRVLRMALARLSQKGYMVVSLPNISHISVSARLLFQRRFRFADAGIMDRTHLRWFTEENAVDLMNRNGMRVTNGVINGLEGRRARLINLATLGVFRHWLAKQYIMAAEVGDQQSAVRWQVSTPTRA